MEKGRFILCLNVWFFFFLFFSFIHFKKKKKKKKKNLLFIVLITLYRIIIYLIYTKERYLENEYIYSVCIIIY